MRNRLVVLVVAVVALATGWPGAIAGPKGKPDGAPPDHEVDGDARDWAHARSTMEPGTAASGGGVWSFTDYPYDDKGAGGSFAYPSAPGYNGNAADPVVLQVAPSDEAVHYLVRMNTMVAPDSVVVALAVDTDDDDATGGGAWPYGADVSTAGWEHVITVWGTGGSVTTPDGASTPIAVATDLDENLIEFAVPHAVADPATGGGTWSYRGGAGVWDAAAGSWAEVVASSPLAPATSPTGGDGSAAQPDLFNVLFRNRTFDGGTEETDENASSSTQFARQSTALTAATASAENDLAAFRRTVDFAALSAGASSAPAVPHEDRQTTRVYATEGIATTAYVEGVTKSSTSSTYNGRYHPYILFVPATYWSSLPTAAPMLPLLHGWLGDHRGFNPSDNAFWNEVVRANGALVPKPLGRGGEVWYEHIGELDVLEVIADVAAHYVVDEDRIYLGGTSMGGLGTIKISEAHPDLFAGVFPSVPPASDRATGYVVPAGNDWDLVEQADSLRNVPVRNFTGTYDALVPVGNDSRRFCERLAQLVYDHDCWRDISPNGGHRGYENDRAAQLAQLLVEHPRRVVSPDRVTYEIHPVWRQQAIDNGLGALLPYDAAYWTSGLAFAPAPELVPAVPEGTPPQVASRVPTGLERRTLGTGFGRIDARTHGRGGTDPVATAIEDDPSPTLLRDGLVLRPGPTVTPRNAFEVTTENLSAASLDLGRMALTLLQPLAGSVTTDQPLTLTLLGDGRRCTATIDGVLVAVSRVTGGQSVTVPSGTHDLRVSCRR